MQEACCRHRDIHRSGRSSQSTPALLLLVRLGQLDLSNQATSLAHEQYEELSDPLNMDESDRQIAFSLGEILERSLGLSEGI